MTEQTLLQEKLREIINKHDPINLLKAGCPVDEYDPEIDRIVPKLREATNVNELHKSIYEIFVEMFDKDNAGPKGDYRKLSEEIYSLKK